MDSSKFLLSFIGFVFTLNLHASKKSDYQKFDNLMLKNCVIFSEIESCNKKLREIHQGMSINDIGGYGETLSFDDQIQVTLVNESQKMIQQYYCLANFLDLIRVKDVDPETFAYAIKGFSYSISTQDDYQKWISSDSSKDCRAQLKNLSLEIILPPKTKNYHIVLNPISYLEKGADDGFKSELKNTLNHERMHIAFAVQQRQKNILEFWNSLSEGQKNQFKKEHPSYNFSNEQVLVREFFSYTFELFPSKGIDFLNGKYKGWDYSRVLKEQCLYCVTDDIHIKNKLEKLVSLEPKEILEKIENEKIKVLILSSGRKNPSKFFYWGKIRTDQGLLNQITKLEGSMGKTLCQGEKEESKKGITIVLASDSPLSTLLHEYLHVQQIKKDSSWCFVSKTLWGRSDLLPFENRMIRDREWDVRNLMWDFINIKAMNVEDRLMLIDGMYNEVLARKEYDPQAEAFEKKNDLKKRRQEAIQEYMNAMK